MNDYKYCSIIMTHYSLADDFGQRIMASKKKKIYLDTLEEVGLSVHDYNRSKVFQKSILSLVNNTKYPHELIVVDNGGRLDDSGYILDLLRSGKINIQIRNKDNMHFAYGRNQAYKLSTGDYICITDNDIYFREGWLERCIEALDNTPGKYIASPYITPDKDTPKFNLVDVNGYRCNSSTGSNCMVIRREDYEEIGDFMHNEVGGTYWHRTLSKKGYSVLVPKDNYVEHLGGVGGYNFRERVEIVKTLSDGTRVDFTQRK